MAKGEVVLVIACMLVTWHGFMNLLLKKENGGAIGLTAVQHPVGGGGSSQQHPSVTTNTVLPLFSHINCISRCILVYIYTAFV